MSLDNISHPGGMGHDELVPSRYALRVGEIHVLVVSDGVLSLPGAMLAHNADPAVRSRIQLDRAICSSSEPAIAVNIRIVEFRHHSVL